MKLFPISVVRVYSVIADTDGFGNGYRITPRYALRQACR